MVTGTPLPKRTLRSGYVSSVAQQTATRKRVRSNSRRKRALEEAHKVGQKPVEADIIDNVLAKDINGLEPRLTREGYNTKVLAELLNAKPREIKGFLRGQLPPGRTQELQTELLAVGIPL
jgi:predicted metal-dependent peptidase